LVGVEVSEGASKRFLGAKGSLSPPLPSPSILIVEFAKFSFYFPLSFSFRWRFNTSEPLSLLDVISINGRVKHMSIVSSAAGTFFQHKGLKADKEFAADHFREAIERYEEALEADPQDGSVLFFMALTWYSYFL
jgi:hypothetical protein